MLERILRGTAATIENTFSLDGVDTDPSPDDATVQILRDDGTELAAAGSDTSELGAGRVGYTFTPADTADLDHLTARWTAHIEGYDQTLETHIEIVGGFLFSIADARRDETLADTGEYPTADIVRERTAAESDIEDACRRAFVPRYRRETCWGVINGRLALRRDLRRLRWVKVDGTLLTSDQLAAVRTLAPRRLLLPVRGLAQRVDVAYECGDDIPPARGREAALVLAKVRLTDGPITDRAMSLDTENGRINMATPGVRGASFGIPTVDAFVQDFEYVDLLPA